LLILGFSLISGSYFLSPANKLIREEKVNKSTFTLTYTDSSTYLSTHSHMMGSSTLLNLLNSLARPVFLLISKFFFLISFFYLSLEFASLQTQLKILNNFVTINKEELNFLESFALVEILTRFLNNSEFRLSPFFDFE
jgi:hypothetical protein